MSDPKKSSPERAFVGGDGSAPQRTPASLGQAASACCEASLQPLVLSFKSNVSSSSCAAEGQPPVMMTVPPPTIQNLPSRRRASPSQDQSLNTRALLRSSLAVSSCIDHLPNEVLLHILGYLDVDDLLTTSRTCHHLRCLAVAPILHTLRRRQIRAALPPLLASPMRPSLTDLIQRHIFLTSTTVVSRKLTRSLVSIRLSRRLAARPSVHVLVERCVLPPECAPVIGHVAPALAARTRAVEREKLKDGLRRWMGSVWLREVDRRSERVRKCDEKLGVGKVWRLRKFWERLSHSSGAVNEVGREPPTVL